MVFRTLNQDLGEPNHNDDYYAVKMRDEVIPVRSWCLRKLPWTKRSTKVGGRKGGVVSAGTGAGGWQKSLEPEDLP